MARGIGTISNITGLVNQHELSVVELKTLRNLRHNSLGIWASATPENPSVVAAGGTAVFRKQKLVRFGQYTSANRNDQPDLPASQAIKASIIDSDTARYELETLDLPGLAYGSRDAFLTYIAAGISTGLAAIMDARYIKLAVDTITGITDPTQKKDAQIVNANWSDLVLDPTTGNPPADYNASKFNIQTGFRQAARGNVAISRGLTAYNIGSRMQDYAVMLHQNIQNDFLELVASNGGGDSATQIARDLTTPTGSTIIAGLGVVKDHLFFGQDIKQYSQADESGIHKNEAYDFSNIWGVIAHKEALFLAIQGLTTVATISPNSGNQNYITKFNYFSQAIRPDLVKIFVETEIV